MNDEIEMAKSRVGVGAFGKPVKAPRPGTNAITEPEDLDMRIRLFVVACIAAFSAASAHAEAVPVLQKIQDWWKVKNAEELTIEGPLQEVHLMNKEVAFIAPAGFFERGRNDIFHAVLVRPELQEVRELPYPVGDREITVKDIDDDGVSEVLSVSVSSGQGTTHSVHSIIRLDGATPVLLHEAIEEDNLGDCYQGCEKVHVDWKFGRQSVTGDVSLTETVTTSIGRSPDRLKPRTEVRRYVLVGNTFVRADARSLRHADQVKIPETGAGAQGK